METIVYSEPPRSLLGLLLYAVLKPVEVSRQPCAANLIFLASQRHLLGSSTRALRKTPESEHYRQANWNLVTISFFLFPFNFSLVSNP